MTRKTFKLSIDLENDSFQDMPVLTIADMLERLATKLRSDTTEYSYALYQNLKDENGNIVGEYAIKETK